jgi:hypothetical protein
MNPDPLETQLQRLRFREVPPAWRGPILATVRADRNEDVPEPVKSRQPPTVLLAGLSRWLWPHPRAWAGLAAAWLAVFTMGWWADQPLSDHELAFRQVEPVPAEIFTRHQAEIMATLAELEPAPPPGSAGVHRSNHIHWT